MGHDKYQSCGAFHSFDEVRNRLDVFRDMHVRQVFLIDVGGIDDLGQFLALKLHSLISLCLKLTGLADHAGIHLLLKYPKRQMLFKAARMPGNVATDDASYGRTPFI